MPKRNENPKFKKLTSTAYELFLRHGMRRVSIEEICAKAEVSKMTYYKFFKNKTELVKYLLEKVFAEQMGEYRAIMARDISFQDKVKLILRLKHEQTKLMSQEFFNEMTKDSDPEIGELIGRLSQRSAHEVLDSFKESREKGEIRGDIKPEFILYILNQLIHMAEDKSLACQYESLSELTMELTNFFFYGILTPDAKGEA